VNRSKAISLFRQYNEIVIVRKLNTTIPPTSGKLYYFYVFNKTYGI